MKNSIHPALILPKSEARRFMLNHQGLLPPRQWTGAEGVIEFIRRVGCIQFDPVNVVERNPELVLQARVGAYTPALLDDLLYGRRVLLDGFDKVASIYPIEDWPAFSHRRRGVREYHDQRADLEEAFMQKMIQTVGERGPLSSLDFEETVRINGYWGADMRIERFALERLLSLGDILIHHRAGSRRYYDVPERILPPSILSTPDPFADFKAYQDWHVLRRIGGMGIAYHSSTETWLGIFDTKAPGRWESLMRLVDKGLVLPVEIEDVPQRTFFVRAEDWQRYQKTPALVKKAPEITFLGPLDNLLWDRNLIRWVFDFEYTWEIYTPVHKRKYGPYTLPVLYGETLVGRVDSKLDKKKRTLAINNWWWEKGIKPDEEMVQALTEGYRQFLVFLKAEKIQVNDQLKPELGFLEKRVAL